MDHNVEVWIVMNSDGEYAVNVDRDSAVESFEEQIGEAAGCRIARLNVLMTPPVEADVAVTVPDEAGELVEADAE